MLFFKKVIAFLKRFWYIPVGLALAVIGAVALRDKNAISKWSSNLKDAKELHKKDVKIIQESHQRQIDANNVATKRALEVQRQVLEEYQKNERELDAQQKKRIVQITNKLKHDPRAMAEEIEKATGYRVLIIE